MLSSEELEIYTRQLGIASWGTDVQEKLKRSKAFIAGCGGLGSPVLYYLAAAGVGTLILCDFDIIEPSNLNRQILHRYESIGKPKVESARNAIRGMNPFIITETRKAKMTGSNAADLVGNADIIIDCLDSFASRHILNRLSVSRGIPMIHAGVSGFMGQVTLFHPPETPCLACIIPGKKVQSNRSIAGVTPGVIGSIQAMEAVKYLGGIGDSLKGRMLFFDGVTMKFETVFITKNPRCRVCAK